MNSNKKKKKTYFEHSRLLSHASNRLASDSNGGSDLALISSCAAGGLGYAMVLQRHPRAQ